MAKQLDLQEQEQLDELKAFWKQHGSLITWVLTLALLAFAGWNGWNYWLREESAKASVLFGELEKAVQAGDVARGGQLLADMQTHHRRTAYAQQAGLLVAKLQLDKGQQDAARASLAWVAEHATETEYRSIARLRLAGLLMEAKQYDEALKQLAEATAPEFAALVADRRGDVLLAQGKKEEAKAAYDVAFKGMDEKTDYRRLVEAKLTALGAAPMVAAAASGAAR